MDFLTLFSSLSRKFITFLFLSTLIIFSAIYKSSCSLFFNVFVHCFLSSYSFVPLRYSVYSFSDLHFLLYVTFIYFSSRRHSRPVASSRPLLPCSTFLVPFGIDCEIFLGRLPPFFYTANAIIYVILYFYSYYKFLFSTSRLHFLYICHSSKDHIRNIRLYAAQTFHGSQYQD